MPAPTIRHVRPTLQQNTMPAILHGYIQPSLETHKIVRGPDRWRSAVPRGLPPVGAPRASTLPAKLACARPHCPLHSLESPRPSSERSFPGRARQLPGRHSALAAGCSRQRCGRQSSSAEPNCGHHSGNSEKSSAGFFGRLRKFPEEMERPMRIELTPEPWQICRERSVNNLRGTFRSTK